VRFRRRTEEEKAARAQRKAEKKERAGRFKAASREQHDRRRAGEIDAMKTPELNSVNTEDRDEAKRLSRVKRRSETERKRNTELLIKSRRLETRAKRGL
jgi:hypothetical protein